MNILYIAKSSDEVLASKLEPLLLNSDIDKIYLLRSSKYPSESPKLIQYNKFGNPKILRIFIKVIIGIYVSLFKKIDFVFSVHLYPHGYIGYIIAKLTFKKQIHVINAGHREVWCSGKLIESINKYILKKMYHLVVMGSNTKSYLKPFIDENKISIIKNTVFEKFENSKKITDRKYSAITICRLGRNKNTITLLKSIELLVNNNDEIQLLVIGDGSELSYLKSYVEEKNLSNSIRFLGWKSHKEVLELLSNTRIFCLLSKGEGVPRSMLEAMNLGCVPIVTNVGDISDYVINNKTGFLIDDPLDYEQVAQCLSKIHHDQKNQLRISEEVEKFTQNNNFLAVVSSYEKLLKKLKK